MKTQSKSSKKAAKKPAAKKKRVAAKSVKKTAPAKKTRKASTKKMMKKTVAKKRAAATPRKKKSILKPVKNPPAGQKPVPTEAPGPVIQETIVSITEITTADALPPAPIAGLLIGRVADYDLDSKIAIIELYAGNLQPGDMIHIKGDTTDFEQAVVTIDIKNPQNESAEAGQAVAVKLIDVVREHDKVYKKGGS